MSASERLRNYAMSKGGQLSQGAGGRWGMIGKTGKFRVLTERMLDNYANIKTIGKAKGGMAKAAKGSFYGYNSYYPTQKSADINDGTVGRLKDYGLWRLNEGPPTKLGAGMRGAFKTAMRRAYIGKGRARSYALEFNNDQNKATSALDHLLMTGKSGANKAAHKQALSIYNASNVGNTMKEMMGIGSEGRLTSRAPRISADERAARRVAHQEELARRKATRLANPVKRGGYKISEKGLASRAEKAKARSIAKMGEQMYYHRQYKQHKKADRKIRRLDKQIQKIQN